MHFLVLEEFVNKFKIHVMSNTTVDTNVFDK